MKSAFIRRSAMAALTLISGGCAQWFRPDDVCDGAVVAKVAVIDEKLRRLATIQPSPPDVAAPAAVPAVPAAATAPDPATTGKIKALAAQPTREEVAAYVADIVADEKKPNPSLSMEERRELIAKVGRGRIEAWAPYVSAACVADNLPQLVGSEDRAEVLRLIPDYPAMLKIVTSVGPLSDAELREAIVKAARKKPGLEFNNLLRPYMELLVADTATWHELKELSISEPGLWIVFFRSIKNIPVAERRQRVTRAWEKQKDLHAMSPAVKMTLIQYASRMGELDALDREVAAAVNDAAWTENKQRALLRVMPDSRNVPHEQLDEWYKKNRDSLRYDAVKCLYALPPGSK